MEESRLKKTSKNFIFALIFQLTKILLTFINRIIFVRILGATYLGINGLFSNILSVLSIADLGITTAMMYSLYKPLAQNDEKKVAQYINYFKKVFNIIAIVVLVLGIGIIPFLQCLVNLPGGEIDGIYEYYILMVINTVITYLYIYKTTLLSADQKMHIISKYDTIFQILTFIIQVVVLLTTKSFKIYILVNVITTFLSNLFKSRAVDRTYPYLSKYQKEKLERIAQKEVFTNVKSLFFYRIGGVIQSNTDNILISIFVGTIAVGYFSNYSMIILTVTSFLTMIFNSVKASLGNYINVKNKTNQLEMFEILEVFNFWLVGFCSICFMMLIPPFIEIFFGKEYVLDRYVLIFAVLNFYTNNIRQTIWMYRETTGLFNRTKYITLVSSILNIVFSLILGYYFGINGILGATIIARMMSAWWREPVILFNEYFGTSSQKYFSNHISRIFYVIVIYCLLSLINSLLKIDNLLILFIMNVGITSIVSIILLILPFLKNQNMILYMKKILKIVRRNE